MAHNPNFSVEEDSLFTEAESFIISLDLPPVALPYTALCSTCDDSILAKAGLKRDINNKINDIATAQFENRELKGKLKWLMEKAQKQKSKSQRYHRHRDFVAQERNQLEQQLLMRMQTTSDKNNSQIISTPIQLQSPPESRVTSSCQNIPLQDPMSPPLHPMTKNRTPFARPCTCFGCCSRSSGCVEQASPNQVSSSSYPYLSTSPIEQTQLQSLQSFVHQYPLPPPPPQYQNCYLPNNGFMMNRHVATSQNSMPSSNYTNDLPSVPVTLIKVHGIDPKGAGHLVCFCGIQFPTKIILLDHLNSLDRIRPSCNGIRILCGSCHKYFKSWNQCNLHAKMEHPDFYVKIMY